MTPLTLSDPVACGPPHLEALELLRCVSVLLQAGVEDEELGVSQPRLQLFDSSLQLLQQRVGQRRERRPRVVHCRRRRCVTSAHQGPGAARLVVAGRAGPRVLGEDFL